MRFSVIIPLYNKAPYVSKAIESVLAQTFTDFELVIVDDGSKDDSAEIAAKAIEGRANCHLFRQANAGVSVARNNGVAVSHGDFLCFLDADDWWDPAFLEEMANMIEDYPEAGIYGAGYTIVNETKHKTRVADIGVEKGFEKGHINYCQVYAKTMAMPLTSSSVAIPKRVFCEYGGFPQGVKLGEDFVLWIHVALKYKVAFLNKPLSYYNQDVNAENRGIGKLYKPEEHMLWNLADLEPVESQNSEYKHLIDSLRVNALMPYYLSKEYRKDALSQLNKVDWTRQSAKTRREYKRPIGLLKLKCFLLKKGSLIKQTIIRFTNGTSNSDQKLLDRQPDHRL